MLPMIISGLSNMSAMNGGASFGGYNAQPYTSQGFSTVGFYANDFYNNGVSGSVSRGGAYYPLMNFGQNANLISIQGIQGLPNGSINQDFPGVFNANPNDSYDYWLYRGIDQNVGTDTVSRDDITQFIGGEIGWNLIGSRTASVQAIADHLHKEARTGIKRALQEKANQFNEKSDAPFRRQLGANSAPIGGNRVNVKIDRLRQLINPSNQFEKTTAYQKQDLTLAYGTPTNPYSQKHLDNLLSQYGQSSDGKTSANDKVKSLLSAASKNTNANYLEGANYVDVNTLPNREANAFDFSLFEGTEEQQFLSGKSGLNPNTITKDNPFDVDYLIRSQLARFNEGPNSTDSVKEIQYADASDRRNAEGMNWTYGNAPEAILSSSIDRLNQEIRAAGVNPEFLRGSSENNLYIRNRDLDARLNKAKSSSRLNQTANRTPAINTPGSTLGGAASSNTKSLLGD